MVLTNPAHLICCNRIADRAGNGFNVTFQDLEFLIITDQNKLTTFTDKDHSAT